MNEDVKIRENLPLVSFVIKRYYPGFAWDEDLFQVGCMGLLYAVRKFNPDKGVAFSTFAVRCIRTHIMSLLRNRNLPCRAGRVCVSLDNVAYRDDHGEILLGDTLPSPTGEPSEVPILIAEAKKRLTKREWDIIQLKAAGYTQQEIGTALGVTQVHVSRILSKAYGKMRLAIAG